MEMIYEELEKHKLTVVGGRAAGVGVGGLITGGKEFEARCSPKSL